MTDLKLSFDSISRIDRPSLVSQLATVARVASRLGGCDCSRRPCIDHKNRRCPATSYKLYEDKPKNTLKTYEGINYFLFLITFVPSYLRRYKGTKVRTNEGTCTCVKDHIYILPISFDFRSARCLPHDHRSVAHTDTRFAPKVLGRGCFLSVWRPVWTASVLSGSLIRCSAPKMEDAIIRSAHRR